LLIPELGSTEIFEPICQGMMQSPLGKSHSLIWGYSPSTDEEREGAAEQLCHQYIAQKVSGVFFAPLEYTATRNLVNRRIISALAQASMPVVLLDRCYEEYPARSPYDLVGIDNHRAAFVLTRHLQNQGARRILFAARPNSASTVAERIAGYYDALRERAGYVGSVWNIDVSDTIAVRSIMDAEQPDAFVCANDLTAAHLMKALEHIGVTIPRQVRVVGIDDVNYAKFLPVPLTTVRQDCAEIGAVAMSVMLERLERPTRPPREVLVHFDLVVRESCGAHLKPSPQTMSASVHV
jgi:DNA-binding LacI/PurR family transcriptional regulator